MQPRQPLLTAQERREESPVAIIKGIALAIPLSLLAWIGLILASIALL
jgi:hypothetical protein